MGEVARSVPTAVSIHFECVVGDALGSTLCDCGRDLQDATERIATAGGGVLVYLRPRAADSIALHRPGSLPFSPHVDRNSYVTGLTMGNYSSLQDFTRCAAQMLRIMGVTRVALLHDQHGVGVGLASYDLELLGPSPLGA
jgi:GTP cyclohydrolase II